MRLPIPTSRRKLLLLSLACGALGALAGAVAWAVIALSGVWKGSDLVIAVSVAASAGGAIGAVFGQPLFAAWLTETLSPEALLTTDQLDRWTATLRTAVLDRRVRGATSQREQILHGGILADHSVAPDVRLRVSSETAPRIVVAGKTVPWSGIVREWRRSQERLVVLGEPGYGKTVAALGLVEEINNTDPVRLSELFSLAEWYAWEVGRPDARLEHWLAEALSVSYGLPPSVAHTIIARNRLVPILDGLDEIPKDARNACKEAIDAYAGRAPEFRRPFVVTCRRQEYLDLAPDWVAADRHVILAGLTVQQIASAIQERAQVSTDWEAVRTAVLQGDGQLETVLRSPLRLGLALKARRRASPELLRSFDSPQDAQNYSWDTLLDEGAARIAGSRPLVPARQWLGFIAASLQAHDRQRLWLHELYLYVSPEIRRGFERLLVGGYVAVSVTWACVNILLSRFYLAQFLLSLALPCAVGVFALKRNDTINVNISRSNSAT